jgi:gliding motility-associated lipoprotein GldH
MKGIKKLFVPLVPCALLLFLYVSCATVDLYEKSVAIPGHAWKNSFKPTFTFTIKDTTASYQLYLVLRHNDKYSFNNIYLNIYSKQPGIDTLQKAQFDLLLATNEKGWLAGGMDDIYEHRILLTPRDQQLRFRKGGDYTFTLEQIMREDPLENVLDVGLRIEKKQ